MSWHCCCGTVVDPPPCTTCTADASTITLTISGSADSVCNQCNEFFNGVYILSRQLSNACLWKYTNYNHNCYATGWPVTYGQLYLQASAQQLFPSSNKGWVVGIIYSVTWWPGGFPPPTYTQQAVYRWNSGSSSSFDCTATRTPTLYSYTPDPTAQPCLNLDSLTITIN